VKTIVSFRHKGLKQLFERGNRRGVNPQHVDKIENILGVLDIAQKIEDVDVHSFRLHPLTGDLKGFWSVTVRANWRVVFRFDNGNVFEVDLLDYH
jgi:proteic killer suppression protein